MRQTMEDDTKKKDKTSMGDYSKTCQAWGTCQTSHASAGSVVNTMQTLYKHISRRHPYLANECKMQALYEEAHEKETTQHKATQQTIPVIIKIRESRS